MKRCSPSLVIKEIQILIKVFTWILLEYLSSRKPTTNSGEDAGKNEPSYTAGWNVNYYYNHFRKQYGGFL
jgi:hypothetical protein